jgi:glutaredoxin-like protein
MGKNADSILLYGASWCPDARRSRRFLDERAVPYTWFDVDEDEKAAEFVREKNGGQIVLPTILFPDGSILVEPSNSELDQKLKSLE